jgi:hypothetical protein
MALRADQGVDSSWKPPRDRGEASTLQPLPTPMVARLVCAVEERELGQFMDAL